MSGGCLYVKQTLAL